MYVEVAVMVDMAIKYEPFRELVIMDHVHFSTVDELVRFANVTAGGKTVGIYWAEGVAFIYYPLVGRETVVKSLIEKGRIYWTFVGSALMPKYQPIVETREKIIAPVINMSGSSLFVKVARWLKERTKERGETEEH